MSSPLIVQMDVAEPRIKLDRLVVSADGSTWDMRRSTLYMEPVSRTLLLPPLPITDAWQTTFAGQYARYGKTDYTLTTEGLWAAYGRKEAGDIYLTGLGTNERVTTTATFPANQAVYIAAYVWGTGTENAVILECGWGTPGASDTVSLRFRANGDAEVYKGTALVGVYDFRTVTEKGEADTTGKRGKGKSQSLSGRTASFLLIPYPRRGLLVIALDSGGGFLHTFEDLDPVGSANIITPSTTFFWQVPTTQPVVQFAPLKYAVTGAAFSPVVNLRYAPNSTQTFTGTVAEEVLATGTTAFTPTLVKPDFSAYTPNGTQKQVRVRAQMTGDGSTTRFLYAVDMVCPRTATTTANAPFDLLPYLTQMTMDVPESGQATVHLTCKTPDAMTTAGLAKARIIGDRPVRVSVDGKDIFRGTTGKPIITEGAGRRDSATLIEWTATDRETEFDMYSFRDTFPYDGLLLTNAVTDLVKTAGFADADIDVSTDTFVLPYSTDVSLGKWQLLPLRGETANQWLKRLWQDYAQTWVTGWAPTSSGYKYRFRRPDTFSDTPLLELFETTAGAKVFGIAADFVTRRVVRNLKQQPEAAPANEVFAVGYDPKTDKYPQSQFDDDASQNPELAPSARPDNWRGRVVAYQLIDANLINNQATADRVRDILRDRACVGREVIEIECEFLVRVTGSLPLWKGDVVRIYKNVSGEVLPNGSTAAAHVVRGDYRILSIPSIEFLLEGGRNVPLRPCTYKLLKIGPGT